MQHKSKECTTNENAFSLCIVPLEWFQRTKKFREQHLLSIARARSLQK
jgi:hypothetical protein